MFSNKIIHIIDATVALGLVALACAGLLTACDCGGQSAEETGPASGETAEAKETP
jgi:hypothetical protein